jgi:Leucine-rich repeat (LRR) protein
MSNNNLTGPFPDVSLLSNLKSLSLSNNQFSGEIPNVFANLPNLLSLYVIIHEFQLRRDAWWEVSVVLLIHLEILFPWA